MNIDQDLGVSLLLNRKKVSSDALSDKGSVYDDKSSVRSISIRSPIVDVRERDESGSEGDDTYETESESAKSMSIRYEKTKHRTDDSESTVSSRRSYKPRMSDEDILERKRELLYQFERLEKKGVKMPRRFSLSSNLEEMETEYQRLVRDKEIDASIRFQRRMLMAFVSGVEYLNGKFDPVGARLDGWSDSVYENVDEYDGIFEELHDKYKSKTKMPPEVRLVSSLAMSGFLFHMTNSMFKTQLPGLDQVLKQNPELARQLAAATNKHMSQQSDTQNSFFGSLGNMFTGMFGGGGATTASAFTPPENNNVKMSGPSNVEDIIRELETGDNDRIEMMSAITESELGTDIDIESVNGVLAGKKKTKAKAKRGISLNLD